MLARFAVSLVVVAFATNAARAGEPEPVGAPVERHAVVPRGELLVQEAEADLARNSAG